VTGVQTCALPILCINGASGGVGSFAVQIAVAFGAEVTAICSESTHDFVRTLGATHTLDYRHQDIADSEQRFEIFFDVFGNYDFGRIKHLLTKGGVYVTTVPKLRNFADAFRTRFIGERGAKVVNVHSHRENLDAITELINTGKLRPIIEKTYTLEEIQLAHEHIQTKHTHGKVVIKITKKIE